MADSMAWTSAAVSTTAPPAGGGRERPGGSLRTHHPAGAFALLLDDATAFVRADNLGGWLV